ncbi:phage-related baseplate assembly protein [Collimonas sp. PA-H2]|uniref:baseplate assembly protein n=1 Tax=Collimonas sp. PA-H2 TaxID=1881062 RepID=UPI000BF39900|nr:baseplate J/gp47 family protein [Collimonas sp. PA-H2]PFH10860.1 phage-related baseplate assembly protein [Collimonas sp. PA-H2]
MSAPIDLSLLPAPSVIETVDYEVILASRKAAVLELLPAEQRATVAAMLSLESEPATKLLEENSYREMILRTRINDAARALMLAYAVGSDLDHIGANSNVSRLVVTPADPNAVPPVAEVREEDDAYRLRIQEAPDGLSVAGPRSSYEFHARSADGRVKDASATSPSPAVVVITILSALYDGIADRELLDIVYAALSAEDIRPIGDRLIVQIAQIIDYQIEATLYVGKGPVSPIAIATAKSRATIASQPRRPLKYSIYRTALTAALHVEGVRHVDLISPPANLLLDATQAARCTGIRITVQVEDE